MSEVTEQLMAVGSWRLDLADETPDEVRDLAEKGFARLVVTPVRHRCGASSDISFTDLLAKAIYSGVLRADESSRTRFSGVGLAALLGDEDGKANTWPTGFSVSARPLYNGSATSWVRTNVLRVGSGGANGITVGSISSAASPTRTGAIEAGDSPRDVLTWACRAFTSTGTNPYEWRVTAGGALDVALRNTLWTSGVSPTAIASRSVSADDSVLDGVPVTDWGDRNDLDDWHSTVYVYGDAGASDQDIASNSYVDLAGDPLLMRRVQQSRNAGSLDADALVGEATRLKERFDDPARFLDIRSDIFDPHDAVTVGDTMWVYDLGAGLVGSTPVPYGGEVVFPLATRVTGMTWPLRDGMGVYLRSWNGSAFELADLSEYIVWGGGDVRFEVGSPRRLLGLSRSVSRAA